MATTECRMLRGAPPCCPECHEAFRYDDSEPLECDVDGLIAQVCCAVAVWLAHASED